MIEKKYLRILNKLVQQQGLEIIDVHVHPFDVMETPDSHDYHKLNELLYQHEDIRGEKYSLKVFRRTSIADRLKLNRFANDILSLFDGRGWRNLTERVKSPPYQYIGIKRLVDEMKMAGIKKEVLLSVEPFNKLQDVYKYYKHSDQFFFLASVDIHQMNKYEILQHLNWQIKYFPVVGIKLHPNLQGFYPYPPDNSPSITDKLEAIYHFARENDLYIMLHSGLFEIPVNHEMLQNYPVYQKRASDKYGMISGFVNDNGYSPLFDTYNNTFLIAHMFYSGTKYTQIDRISGILNKYPHVYADTSNVPAFVLSEVIKHTGSGKLLFGSNALYNKQLIELLVTIKSIENGAPDNRFEDYCLSILGRNFKQLLARQAKHENSYIS